MNLCWLKSKYVYLYNFSKQTKTPNQPMKKILLGSLMLLCITVTKAQVITGKAAEKFNSNAELVRFDARSNSPLFIAFKSSSFISAANGIEGLSTMLGMSSNDSWKLIRSDKDDLGMNHARYQQYYKNLKVITGEYILHEQQGRVLSANGLFLDHLNMNTNAVLDEEQAFNSALIAVPASKYLWQCSLEEQHILMDGKMNGSRPNGELVILPSLNTDKKQSTVLCWMFDIYASQPHERWLVYINAQNGKLVFKENKICTVTTNGTAVTKYSGTQTIKVDSLSANSYRLREYSRGSGVETYNCQNGTSYATAVDFTDTDNLWNTTTNQDNAAYDAHFGAEKTYDYFFLNHGRNSYNNTGGVLKSYIHYSTAYNNAFWNGAVMTYGDGDGSTFSPLTELDICAHELTHGVTEYSSNLVYSYESGALNESFSDIFGVAVDFYAKPTLANWLIGDLTYTPSTPNDALRYMNNPNLGGQPDTYLGTSWYTGPGDNGGVHYNSGVQNFWYYLLCVGGTGTNDNGFVYNVGAIGMTKASKIAYRTNSFYLTSGSQYVDAGFYSIKSANDLYGNCSVETFAVKNAWDAVGVAVASLNSNATASISGGSCVGNTLQFTAAGGTIYSWTGPNGFTSSIANPTIPAATLANNGVYTCIVTDGAGCSGTAKVTAALNAPPTVIATGGTTGCSGGSAQLLATASVPGQGGNVKSNTTPLALPDFPAAGVSSSVTISGSSNANAVIAITLDSLTHTYDGDLKIELIAPNGSVITLANSVGGSGRNFIRTRFVPTGTAIASGAAPFTGSFTPSQAFSSLTGSANGTWSVRVTDQGSVDVGTLWKWTLELPGNSITSYSWTPSTGLNNSTISNPIANPVSTTTYTVTVTDNTGCTASSTATVNVGGVTLSILKNDVSCFGGNTGTATASPVGAGANPTYLWSNGATTATISQLAAGVYTCTVTGAGGCTSSTTATIAQPTPLTLSTATVPATCGQSNGSAVAIVSGGVNPYTYLWNTGVIVGTISNVASGSYTFTVTDANGCTANQTSVITNTGGGVLSAPSTITGTKNGNCINTNRSFSCPVVAGATSYNWTIPANTSINSGQGTSTISLRFLPGFTSGNISVVAANTCSTSGSRSATLRSVPNTPGTITGSSSNLCGALNSYSIAASTTGGTSYTWSVPAGATITNGQGTTNIQVQWPSNSVATGGVCVTSNNTCGSSTSKCITTATTLPLRPSTINGPSTVCANQTGVAFNVASQAGATYTWSIPGTGSITSGQGTSSIVAKWGTTSGSASVVASNSCGSQTSRTKSLTVNCRAANELGQNIQLYPNPNNGNAIITFDEKQSNYTITVNDVLGRVILLDRSNENNYKLNLESQAQGLYFVSVNLADGSNKVFRMIKE
jgi:Zn-dependent metalloprotease/subtilisin-like proprotein convertase family protein